MIAVIDYGMGNIHSVHKAMEALGARVIVASQPQELSGAEKIVLPGVGAFSDAMQELKKRQFLKPIMEEAGTEKPFLGICLGMQLLFDQSQEGEGAKGLGLIRGEVKRFPSSSRFKIPHIGWNQIFLKNNNCPLLKGVDNGAYVYFCHSYYPEPGQEDSIAATTKYGIEFASMVSKGNIFGTQFHPEKSQKVGLEILKNFVEL